MLPQLGQRQVGTRHSASPFPPGLFGKATAPLSGPFEARYRKEEEPDGRAPPDPPRGYPSRRELDRPGCARQKRAGGVAVKRMEKGGDAEVN